ARLIKEELEAFGSNPPPLQTSSELERAIGAALERRRVRYWFREGEVHVVVRGEHRRMPLPAPGGVSGDQFAADLLALPAFASGATELLSSVLPVLRDAAFAGKLPSLAHSDGPGGLLVFYVLEHPELVRYVPLTTVQAAGLSVTSVHEAAL